MPRIILFDWGDTLMSEAGPPDIPMADWPEVYCVDGAADLLMRLVQRYRIALATNAIISTKPDILRALDRVNLTQYISEVFCFTEMGCKKDDCRFWAEVKTSLGAREDDLVMIGDSLEQDVLGPMRAGIRGIWFNWKKESYSGPLSFPQVQFLHEVPFAISALYPKTGTGV